MSKLLKMMVDKASLKEIQFKWYNFVKYAMNKESGELTVQVGDYSLAFGYDETASFDVIHYHSHIEKNVNSLIQSLAQEKGTILKGKSGTNKVQSLQFLALFLGRHLTLVNLHEHSKLDRLDLILAGLRNPLDLVAFRLENRSKERENVFFTKISELCSQDTGFSNGTPGDRSSKASRVMILDNEACNFTLGSRFRVVQAAQADDKAVIGRILQGFGMNPNLRMIQSMFVISKLNRKSFSEIGGHVSGDWATSKKLYRKANLLQEIRDTFFEGDLAVRRIFSTSNPFLRAVGQECFNDIVSDIFQQPIDKRYFDPKLKSVCEQRKLTVSKTFKKQLEQLEYMLEIQDCVLIQGPPLSGKSTLWQVVVEALHYEVYNLSTVTFTDSQFCQRFENFLVS